MIPSFKSLEQRYRCCGLLCRRPKDRVWPIASSPPPGTSRLRVDRVTGVLVVQPVIGLAGVKPVLQRPITVICPLTTIQGSSNQWRSTWRIPPLTN